MDKIKNTSFKNATGKIDYTLTNDYMFRAVLQENNKVLKSLICSLLHLNPHEVKSVVITNPIVIGKYFDDKTFVLDIKVLLNNAKIINLEMQVAKHDFWTNRSLSYLCGIFNNLKKGRDYSKVKPAYHISILNFTPFPDYPEFYATNKMMNIKNFYIYNDNFTLNVLDLNQIHLATDEDKAHKIDYWAKLFKASTWEELKMLAQRDNIFKELGNAVFKFNRSKEARYLCEMREEGERIMNTYKNMLKRSRKEVAQVTAALAEKDSALAKKDSELAKKDAIIAMLRAQLQEGRQ